MKFQSFFGFGPSADIDIVLDGQESRKTAEIKTEDGKKERHFLYYDGETVAGKVHLLEYIKLLSQFRCHLSALNIICHI